mgnify:CR=1 FL=1
MALAMARAIACFLVVVGVVVTGVSLFFSDFSIHSYGVTLAVFVLIMGEAVFLTLLAIGISGFGAEAFRIALDGNPDYEQWSFIGYPLAQAVDGMGSLSGWHQAWWIAHVISFAVFLLILSPILKRWMHGIH